MGDGEDWLYRPLLAGMVSFESYKSGLLDLEDIAVMNEVLDVRDENEYRLRNKS